jgi:hypothetical protein
MPVLLGTLDSCPGHRLRDPPLASRNTHSKMIANTVTFNRFYWRCYRCVDVNYHTVLQKIQHLMPQKLKAERSRYPHRMRHELVCLISCSRLAVDTYLQLTPLSPIDADTQTHGRNEQL